MTQQEITLRILEGALDLIRDIDNWTDGPMGVWDDGKDADFAEDMDDPRICKRCAYGAENAARLFMKDDPANDARVFQEGVWRADDLLTQAAQKLFDVSGIIDVNEGVDRRGVAREDCHAAVVKRYEQAILWAREEVASS